MVDVGDELILVLSSQCFRKKYGVNLGSTFYQKEKQNRHKMSHKNASKPTLKVSMVETLKI
jgi:hypothetical protein